MIENRPAAPPLPLARADLQARLLRAALDRTALVLADAALAFVRGRSWLDFGYARLDDHARERFSRSGRWLRDLAALAKAVGTLPGLSAALTGADGGRPVGRVAALLIGRVADPYSLPAWVDLARRSTVRQLRQAVARARAGGASLPPGRAPAPPDDTSASSAVDSTDQGAPAGAGDDGDDEARTQLRLPVPAAVRAAFDETLDLYRAVVGRQASTTSFVEDLVAEASSGPYPPDADARPLLRARPVAQAEEALARSTSSWRQLEDDVLAGLPDLGDPVPARVDQSSVCLAPLPGDLVGSVDPLSPNSPSSLLEQLDRLSAPSEARDAAALDARIRDLLSIEDSLERHLGTLLAAMGQAGAWLRLHFAGVGHYAEQRLGLSRTQAQTRARVARRLHDRPVLRRAYDSGALGIEATSLLLRLPHDRSAPDGDAAWVARATEVTVKRLRDECRAVRRATTLPSAAPTLGTTGLAPLAAPAASCSADPGAHARRTVSDRSESPGTRPEGSGYAPLTDETWHASLRRDRGTARRRLAELGRSALASRVSTDMLCLRLPAWLADSFLCSVESARRAVESERSFSIPARPTPTWVGVLALLDDFVTTWDPPASLPSARRSSLDEIYARDGWRCAAPGCTSRRNLEDHHLVYRSRGGGNDHANRICLCRFHHQWGEHGDLASCRGKAPLGVLWVLGRRGVGGRYRNERAVCTGPSPPPGLAPGGTGRAL
jgi:hypothetical protein